MLFTGVNLLGRDLSNDDVRRSNFCLAKFTKNTLLPTKLGGIDFGGCDISVINLSWFTGWKGAEVTDTNLSYKQGLSDFFCKKIGSIFLW